MTGWSNALEGLKPLKTPKERDQRFLKSPLPLLLFFTTMHYASLLSEGGKRINLCEQFDIREDIHKHAF